MFAGFNAPIVETIVDGNLVTEHTAKDEMKKAIDVRQNACRRQRLPEAESAREGRNGQNRQDEGDHGQELKRREQVGGFLLRMMLLGWFVAFLLIALKDVL